MLVLSSRGNQKITSWNSLIRALTMIRSPYRINPNLKMKKERSDSLLKNKR